MVEDDDTKTFSTTEVDFMQNKINEIDLVLPSPYTTWLQSINNMNIQEIDIIYKQIKKNEIQPKTGYLFNNLNSGNLEKTVAKLDIMNKLNGFIPRNN